MADEKNGGYSSSQIFSMQQDAVRRVNEMQRLARERVKPSSQQHLTMQEQPLKESSHSENIYEQQIESLPTQIVQKNGFAGILDKLNLDDEKILILLLLLLLVNEGADNMLVLALVYILI